MRILYGVQATGQGHISRARAMSAALAKLGAEVTWLFSGRPRDKLFDMEPFGDFIHRRGLTFSTRNGRICYLRTLLDNNLPQFLRDIRHLELARFDMIVTDYEPVTAWAGRLSGRKTIGIGHQYAFGDATPAEGDDLLSRTIMRNFAPVDLPLGLHWHPYSGTVLPPILDLPEINTDAQGHVVVYLPFEDQEVVTAWLQHFPQQRFVQYASGLTEETRGNIQRRPASIETFKRCLASSAGVICNSGFELISECLQWRKPILTKPLRGQMEQLSNARALVELGYASVTRDLSHLALERWLAAPLAPPQLRFADVARGLSRWLVSGCNESPQQLAKTLWRSPPVLTNTAESAFNGTQSSITNCIPEVLTG